MSALDFDASLHSPVVHALDPIAITLGRNKMEMAWTQRREFAAFSDFVQLFQSAPVGVKDGTCFTPAVFAGSRRRMDESDVIGIATLDSDCGNTLEEIETACSARGWEALIHSTHSHLVDVTAVSATAFDKSGLSAESFLNEKKGFLPRVTYGAAVINEEAGNYIVRHQPCPKFRVILPLSTPWRASAHNDQRGANAAWKERIEALSHALGLLTDQACTDTSRLFYFPRRKSDDAPYLFRYLTGNECDIWSLPDAPGTMDMFSSHTTTRKPATETQQRATPALERKRASSGIDLTSWAVGHAERFQVAAAVMARKPGAMGARRSGVKHHIKCPFDSEHTAPDDRSGTYVVNASDIVFAGLPTVTGFYIGCSHNACAHRDRLDFLGQMIADGWLSYSDLKSPDFLIMEAHDLEPAQFQSPAIVAPAALPAMDRNAYADAPGNIPAHLYSDMPGALGAIHRYIVSTSIRPQPVLALGASLSAMAAVLGRKVMVADFGTRPNIYILGIARTGAGKDRQISGTKDLLRHAGLLETKVGAEDVASDTGILAEARQPGKESHVMLFDEIGKLIRAMGDRNSGPHLKNVVTLLMRLYQSSDSVFKSKSYADSKMNFVIDQPCLSLFGATTPESLYRALSTDDIQAGLMSRVLVFDAGARYPKIAKPASGPPTQAVIDWLTAWDSVCSVDPVKTVGGQRAVTPISVEFSADAQSLSSEFSEEMDNKITQNSESDIAAIYVRAWQNALKIALIRSCSGMPDENVSPRIQGSDMKWAIELSRALTDSMADLVRLHVHDSEFQRSLAIFRDVIKGAGPRGITTKELKRKKVAELQNADKIIEFLMSSEEIAFLNVNLGKEDANGRQIKGRNAYVWNAGNHNDEE